MTNFERIKAMSVDELALFLSDVVSDGYCGADGIVDKNTGKDIDIMEYLKAESEE